MRSGRFFLLRLALAAFLTILLPFASASAQQSPPGTDSLSAASPSSTEGASKEAPPDRVPASWNWLSVWVAGSSLNGELIGTVTTSSIGMLGLRYHHRLAPSPGAAPGGLTYTYTVDVMPVVGLSVGRGAIQRTSLDDEIIFTDGKTTYGVGISPIGLRIGYRLESRFKPFVAGSVGGIYFVDAPPDDRGKKFNFTADLGLGVQIGLTSDTALTIGYRYHHLSNGFRGEINPGIDSHLFSIGLTLIP